MFLEYQSDTLKSRIAMSKIKNIIMADKIKSLRKKMGYTQSELASKLGLLSKHSIKFYEMGIRTPCVSRLIVLIKLANKKNIRDISVQWFYEA